MQISCIYYYFKFVNVVHGKIVYRNTTYWVGFDIIGVDSILWKGFFSNEYYQKSKLRNKINDECFNDLIICYIEREIFKSLDDVDIIGTFTKSKT
jgi:hypothetical protein